MDARFASPIGVESPATRRADAARNKAVRSTGAPVVTFCAMVPSGLRVAGNNRPYRARQSNRQQNGLIHMRNPYKLTTMRDASARPPKRTYRPTRPSDSAVPKTEVWRGFSEFASRAQAAAYDFGTKTLPTAKDPKAPAVERRFRQVCHLFLCGDPPPTSTRLSLARRTDHHLPETLPNWPAAPHETG